MKEAIKKWWWLFLVLPLLGLGAFVIWAQTPLGPMPEALDALQSDSAVSVDSSAWFVFRPQSDMPTTGLIFYPGGRVDPRSYAPAMHALAAQGYLAVIVPMPLNLAVFAPGEAEEVIAANPGIYNWVIGGHSLGGAMAANFVHDHPDLVDGLFFWASYPGSSDDLSRTSLDVISIYAALDGLATPEKVAASRPLLPPNTQWVEINGGNHAQFGWYGDQPNDNPALISREQQQEETLEAMRALLKIVSAK